MKKIIHLFTFNWILGTLTKEAACSHIRSWFLFLDTLKTKALGTNNCEFVAFRCKGGLTAFQNGQCFPQINTALNTSLALDPSYRNDLGKLGEDVRGQGVMYLVTRAQSPYCGMSEIYYLKRIMFNYTFRSSTTNCAIIIGKNAISKWNYTHAIKIWK